MATDDYQSVATLEDFAGGQFSDPSSSPPLYHSRIRAIIFRVKKIAGTIRMALPGDKPAWDRVVNHPLQSWSWGEFRQAMGIDVVRFAWSRPERSRRERSRRELVEGWQLTFHKLPGLPWTVGYFPKGSMPTVEMIKALQTLGKKKQTIFIQLEPNVLANNVTMKQFNNVRSSHRPLFPKYTFVLDLSLSEEELLKNMHPKTRYNIKIAQKHGVVVKEDNSPQAFSEYLRLTSKTTGRQRFYAHSEEYHRTMWKVMHHAGIAHLFNAVYQGSTLAAWIIFVWKDTIYYPYGASARLHREVMAPTLMLWEIAKWGKKQGFKYFDLWGALGPEASERDPWYGFHRFKQGFNPQLVEFIGSYDLVINKPLYELYKIADRLRWFVLKILAH